MHCGGEVMVCCDEQVSVERLTKGEPLAKLHKREISRSYWSEFPPFGSNYAWLLGPGLEDTFLLNISTSINNQSSCYQADGSQATGRSAAAETYTFAVLRVWLISLLRTFICITTPGAWPKSIRQHARRTWATCTVSCWSSLWIQSNNNQSCLSLLGAEIDLQPFSQSAPSPSI